MKKVLFFILFISTAGSLIAQDSTLSKRQKREIQKAERRQRINSIIRQEEEGTLVYDKQSAFGLQLRTNGYGAFYELGRMKSPRFTNLYSIEFTEIKHPKEERIGNSQSFFGNSFIFGKVNNFYALKFGYGQQYIFGQKGNKNGVAVMGIYSGGLSMGLLKPYYLQVVDSSNNQKTIKFSTRDSVLFLNGPFIGGAGFTKGLNEIKLRPGVFAKAALRFDFGRYNESISAIEIGISVETYAKKVEILHYNKQRQLYYQGHLAFLFGRRK